MGDRTIQARAFKDIAGNISYYVVNLEPTGFVIVGGDDLLEPIIAFAPQGTFDPISQNPLYDLVHRDLARKINRGREPKRNRHGGRTEFIP